LGSFLFIKVTNSLKHVKNNIVSPPTLTENGGFFSSYHVLNSGKNKMRAIGILGKFSQIKQEFYNIVMISPQNCLRCINIEHKYHPFSCPPFYTLNKEIEWFDVITVASNHSIFSSEQCQYGK